MKNSKRKIISFILIMVFMVTMFGCNSNKGVDEKQIINDIQQSEYLQKSNMTIEDIQIEKRITDVQDRSDTMIAWVTAKRDTMKGKMCFKLAYTLYNDGWLIGSISHYQDRDWKFIPLKGISQEKADTEIGKRFKNMISSKCIEHKEDLENGTSYFTYELKEKYPYVTKNKIVKLNYEFDVKYDNGLYAEIWEDHADTLENKEDWKINGTWKSSFLKENTYVYGFCKIDSTISINNYDGSTVDCSYDIKITHGEKYHFKDNGTFTVEKIPLKYYINNVVESANGFIVKNKDGTAVLTDTFSFPRQPTFCFDENKGVTFVNPYTKEVTSMTKK